MSVTLILGAVVALLVVIGQVRLLAVIALVVAIGYFAQSRTDYWPHRPLRDHMRILRP
jgi:hypothetical protein